MKIKVFIFLVSVFCVINICQAQKSAYEVPNVNNLYLLKDAKSRSISPEKQNWWKGTRRND